MRRVGAPPQLKTLEAQSTNDWFKTISERMNFYSGTTNPTTTIVPIGQWVLYNNTTLNELRWWINLNGVMVSTLTFGSGVIQKLNNIGGISATGTTANNLRGTATFAAGTTVSVTFPTAEPDVNYFVTLGSNDATKTFSVTAKATTGFTVNASAATSASVDWIMVR